MEVKAIYVLVQTTAEEFVDTQAAVEVVRSKLDSNFRGLSELLPR
jgi:hypothetical protein